MPTVRQLILDASTKPQGSALRVHLNNLNAQGAGNITYNVDGFYVDIDNKDLEIDVETTDNIIDIDFITQEVEVGDSPIYIDITEYEIMVEEI